MTLGASAYILATGVVVWSAAASERERNSGLEELFRANSYPVVLRDGKLSDAGTGFLAGESQDVQFFCIGEPHNVREIPWFMTALFERLQVQRGFHYLAIEQGPFITERIGLLAQSKANDEIRKVVRKRRKALHFRAAEEVEMIADVSRASEGAIAGVWGLDRVLEPAYLEDYLSSSAGSTGTDAEFLKSRAEWSAKNLSMYQAPRGSEDWMSADQHRENGLKTGFRHYYDRATSKDGAPARVLFRFGHVHMGRSSDGSGSSFGHYLSKFAETNDLASFHLSIQLVNKPGHYWSLTEYPEFEPLANVGDPTRWILVDLRPARAALLAGNLAANEKLRRMVVDFDAVLLMGGASKGRKL
jgi:hypothetical protein